MAESPTIPDEAEVRARWGGFAWTENNQRKANEVLGRYPKGREQSASLPLLDFAQRQVGEETDTQGWLVADDRVQAMDFMSRGHMLADTTAILGAMDIVFGECDR